ncbi:MAG: hypothetical protein OXP12_06410 [Thaumarchaeota archaeon]|nr:hypothetical protein [Nitrososphaerota archaeon]MDE0267274.1 hypothetical protein [Nitrososphaerota archaeon]MDE0526511.1 hypothetical protein [Nitrososphaerota archaeon]
MAGKCLPELLLVASLVAGVSLVPSSYSDYPPPLQQVGDGGVDPEDVQCNTGLVHAVRANGNHVCVKETTAERLGWEVFVSEEAAPAEAEESCPLEYSMVDGVCTVDEVKRDKFATILLKQYNAHLVSTGSGASGASGSSGAAEQLVAIGILFYGDGCSLPEDLGIVDKGPCNTYHENAQMAVLLPVANMYDVAALDQVAGIYPDGEAFSDEEAAPAGETARNASPSAEFVDDGRAVEVTAPPKPSVVEENGHSADGSPEAPLRDPRYYVADNKITLEGVENRLPNPTGVWMPVTKEEAEQVLMPRLAAALGDSLILPERTGYEVCVELLLPNCSRFLDEHDPDSLKYYPYDTETGNTFSAWKASEQYPDIIYQIKYRIYDWVPYGEREEFFRSFMEKAGFYGAEADIGDINGDIYGSLVSVHLEFLADQRGPFMQMIFRGWTNEYIDDRLPEGLLLPREELKRRAHAFAAAHTDLWDKEKCTFSLKHADAVDSYPLSVVAGVPIRGVDVGNCYIPGNPGSGPRTQSVIVEATEGEIMWPVDLYYIVEDWAERIDIPKSARVSHSNNDDDR